MPTESNPPIQQTRTEHSVFQNKTYWYIAAKSKELRTKPIRVMLWNEPIALFRDANGTPQRDDPNRIEIENPNQIEIGNRNRIEIELKSKIEIEIENQN